MTLDPGSLSESGAADKKSELCYKFTFLRKRIQEINISEMESITFESNELHYHYIAFSSLPLPIHILF